ncbi:MAG: hypothetical protein V1818_03710 [Candidatus Aenigmatarchaeota archaeon]
MKGTMTVYVIVITVSVIIILLIGSQLLDKVKAAVDEEDFDAFRQFEVQRPYIFDIKDLIVDPNDEKVWDSTKAADFYSGADSDFCKAIKDGIGKSIKTGKSQEIEYKVKPPNAAFKIEQLRNALASCTPSVIGDELYGGTTRKICDFKPIDNYNEYREDSLSLINYQPYIHNCHLPAELEYSNIDDGEDALNYLYSGRGNSTEYGFENGGTVRIVVSNAKVMEDYDGTCSYNIYVCGQNAIAASEAETAVEVFKKIRHLDDSNLYYSEAIVWNGEPKELEADIKIWALCRAIFSDLIQQFLCPDDARPSVPAGYNIYGYNPHYYEFEFSSAVPSPRLALIDAVDAGMWEWSKIHLEDRNAMQYFLDEYYHSIQNIYFSYSPIGNDDIDVDNGLSFDSGCWRDTYETADVGIRTQIFDSAVESFSYSPSFNHKFKFDSTIIGDKVRMTMGIKKLFITKKPMIFKTLTETKEINVLEEVINKYGLDEDFGSRVILIMDPITFCSISE